MRIGILVGTLLMVSCLSRDRNPEHYWDQLEQHTCTTIGGDTEFRYWYAERMASCESFLHYFSEPLESVSLCEIGDWWDVPEGTHCVQGDPGDCIQDCQWMDGSMSDVLLTGCGCHHS